jgi:hypothetical protein
MKTAKIGMPLIKSRLAQIMSIVWVSLISFGCGNGGGGVTTPPPPPNTLVFQPMTSFSSGGVQPDSIALADFNGDGKMDTVVSNSLSSTIAVFLNNGDGTFGDPIITPVQVTPAWVGAFAVGDFNEDGKPDLAVDAVAGSNATIVFLGNGDGTFLQLPPIPNVGGFIQGKVVDLNDDGHLDLVTCGNGNSTVYLGNGDGSFQAPIYFPYGPAFSDGPIIAITLGDFNSDKKLDIIGIGPVPPSYLSSLVFYAGNGDGTFQAPTAVPLPATNPFSIASADFNGEGKLDTLLGFPNSAVVAPGNGDGTFQLGLASMQFVYITQNFVDNGTMVVRTGDFNVDGKPDAVVGDSYGGIVTLVLNAGIGQTPPPTGTQYQFTLASGISDIAVGDLNGDGLPDMVISNGKTNQITVILSQKQ